VLAETREVLVLRIHGKTRAEPLARGVVCDVPASADAGTVAAQLDSIVASVG
jgi:hypothetical protein